MSPRVKCPVGEIGADVARSPITDGIHIMNCERNLVYLCFRSRVRLTTASPEYRLLRVDGSVITIETTPLLMARV